EFWDKVGTTAYNDVDISYNTFLATGFELVAMSILCPVASDITFHNNIVSPGTTQNINAATQAGAVVVSANSYSTGGFVSGDFPPYLPPPGGVALFPGVQSEQFLTRWLPAPA